MSKIDATWTKPLIGIPARGIQLAGRDRLFVGAYASYIDALHEAGGAVILLPDGDQSLSAARLCDGFLFTGGEDLTKKEWWVNVHHNGGVGDPLRDAFENEIALFAQRARKPTLGICRGLQLVSCALGGKVRLFPSEALSNHQALSGGADIRHTITISENSRLSALYKSDNPHLVVSRHRAQVSRLGVGLKAVAWSTDGVIEAAESSDWNFIGVQWHPEMRLDSIPFKWLVECCNKDGRGL